MTTTENTFVIEDSDGPFESVVCERCLDSLESAGQLCASSMCGSRVMVPEDCEQCGRPLVEGETYRVMIEV